MNLLQQTLDLCKMYEIGPDKSKGQNFLIDEPTYDLMVSSSELSDKDTVIEVGPGLGILTFKLAKIVKKVLAVEIDSKLADILNILKISKRADNVKIFNNDVLKIKGDNIDKLGPYKIVTNLPYNISSIFLRKFLSLANKPELMVVLLQKEVVSRILSKEPKMSLLSISVQFYADLEFVADVPKEFFYPAPKVESAIIKIRPRKEKYFKSYQDEKNFFKLLKHGFSSKRKMLKNNLSSALGLDQEAVEEILVSLNMDSKCRAEHLSIENWLNLYGKLLAFL